MVWYNCPLADNFCPPAQQPPKGPYLRNNSHPLHDVISFNGHMIPAGQPIAGVHNRSLRYGDGLFETMYWDGIVIRNESYHLDRLFHGLKILNFDWSDGFTRERVAEELAAFCKQTNPDVGARIRLNVFRQDGSVLLPVHNKPDFIIESADLPAPGESVLRLAIYDGEFKSTGLLSNIKMNNYLLNILALQSATASGASDAILLNNRGNLCEASSSNIFMVRKGILYTPALSEGCVAGTKRRELVEKLPLLGFELLETAIAPDELDEMEEVFLTNAIRGIRPVTHFRETTYTHPLTNLLVRLLNTGIA